MSTASSSPRRSVRTAKPPTQRDDLDRLGYTYSLRVAALQRRLKAPSVASPKMTLGPAAIIGTLPPGSSFASNGEITPKSPAFSSFRSPDPVDLPLPIRRKKSVLSLRLGKKDELKLPREFLTEFWVVLSAEVGDIGWTLAVRTFLGMLKKGTKTATGANMREITTLYATFTSCLPQAGMGSSPKVAHQRHFLTLLYNSLPTSTHFSNADENDRDLLFRLRAEIQSLLHGPGSPITAMSPTGAEFSPQLVAQGIAAKAGHGLFPTSPVSPTSTINPMTPTSPITSTPSRRANRPASDAGSVRRKPVPMWTGNGEGLDNLVEAAGLIWDISQDALEQDAEELDRFVLEKLYLDQLKRDLSFISRQPGGARRSRHIDLSKELGDLMSGFPELAIPTSPAAFGQQQETFFTPPRPAAVFARLSRRAEALGSRRAIELVDHCRKIWGVEKRDAKERAIEMLVRQWDGAVGTAEEIPLGRKLAGAVADLSAILEPDEDIPHPLEELQNCLFKHLNKAVDDIFPVTKDLAQPLPPSVVTLFQAAPSLLLQSPRAVEMFDALADELRGQAVAEYVTASMELMGDGHSQEIGASTGESGRDAVVEGFERVAAWMEDEIAGVEQTWPRGGPLDPAAIIASKQLPLFLAEMQVLETAVGLADIFVLFDATHRLLQAWERLCPGLSDFDADTFFEPHVYAWLRDTEATETHQWVARTIRMDEWLPEGEGRHSQSVVDLFEFIRNATTVIHKLPLREYKRAIYMVDLARTASAALEQYAGTVSGLFLAEIAPAKAANDAVQSNGKWLSKGKYAYGKLDAKIEAQIDSRRRLHDAFMVSPATLVKLTNLGAAGSFIDDLAHALEAEQTARVLSAGITALPGRQVFSVQVVRGQGLLTRSSKPADAFVAILDGPVRLFKSRTVLGTEDPTWMQAFEVSAATAKPLEVVIFDRQLVGKHERLGDATLMLDPAHFSSEAEREVVLPLTPRGRITLRISNVGRERHDVAYHLNSSLRVLERTANDMQLALIDRMADHLRILLSPNTVATVVKPVKARKLVALSGADIDASLVPVLDYLDENLATINATCAPAMRETLILALWERLVDILLGLLIPPLSDRPASSGLSPIEADVVFKWLQALKAFFAAGIPAATLQAGVYRDMLLVGQARDLPTPALRERAATAVRASSGGAPIRHIPTAVAMGGRARTDADNARVAELLLRILRMRVLDDDFLPSQLAALTRARAC
ncbi:hypothetical protein CcaverHIS002_0403680 [Cutaneotrichosporon cavernicola]|uniref:Uncharacterized protein n=1 Tax=Cutaneotrichosporon cavernicola TaxID=279322 RepID=A0AA48L415_9TREE|nr:uncharacterized protein CcaverHIS019_0403630 [Cutaneotrichosporon cavernicola]BEI83764.1 hypothetical protein CcaverHIS002_0403680 [Cutaneotrichosporon cavernicola]BEI91543.1 hypothetical protein CcaverHIS019_0403630 [Cutaneotrichosporon cavernicola]BEI99320.1 hypothetical protein CcaverHIS631_0403630 [Cutaneotrichosporon cavernicola]BEJ07096.1 hypothetical protein CcaverHIS641_0403650 [Cutaneotrichosporon cavernicola]